MASQERDEGWKNYGLLKCAGIPAPTGQYKVGCVDLMHQLAGDEKGGLLVRLYYPTEATPGAGYPYGSWCPSREYYKGFLSPDSHPSAWNGLLSVFINTFTNPKIPAFDGAPLLGTDFKPQESGGEIAVGVAPRFPVIVVSHGLCGMRTVYSAIVCDLASHGYVVACVEHRDRSAAACLQRVPKPRGREGELQDQWIQYFYHEVPKFHEDAVGNAEAEFPFRNKQVKQRADEMSKTLDVLTLLNEGGQIRNMLEGNYDFEQFKGHLDVSTAAIIGHSFGGGTTVQTLSGDTRFKCGIAMDTWMIPIESAIYSSNTSISQPLYFINSQTFQWEENMKRMLPLTKPEDDNGISPCRIITLKGTHHLNQCDVPFTAVFKTFERALKIDESSALRDDTAHELNLEICHAFLKRHLLNDPAYQGLVPNLDGTDGHSEHILFGTNVEMSGSSPEEGPAEQKRAAEGEGQVEGVGEQEDVAEVQEGVAKGEGQQEGVAEVKREQEDAVEVKGEQEGVAEVEGEQEGVAEVKGKQQEGVAEVEGEQEDMGQQEGVDEEQEGVGQQEGVAEGEREQ